MKRVMSIVLLCCVFAALAVSGCSDKESAEKGAPVSESEVKKPKEEVKSYFYVVEMENEQGKYKNSRLVYKTDKQRMNMKFQARRDGEWKTVSHMINNGEDVYILTYENKMAMKMPKTAGMASQATPDSLLFVPRFDEFMEEHHHPNLEKQGTEKVNGVKATRYLAKSDDGRTEAVFFVDQDHLLRRLEYYEGGNRMTAMDIKEVEINPDFKDSDFQVPSGFTIRSIPGMQ